MENKKYMSLFKFTSNVIISHNEISILETISGAHYPVLIEIKYVNNINKGSNETPVTGKGVEYFELSKILKINPILLVMPNSNKCNKF